jgi:hypothetical protein
MVWGVGRLINLYLFHRNRLSGWIEFFYQRLEIGTRLIKKKKMKLVHGNKLY